MRIICNWGFTRKHTRGRPGAADCGMAYLVGLQQLGHEVFLVEHEYPKPDRPRDYRPPGFDQWRRDGVRYFESLAKSYGIWPRCCLIHNDGEQVHGMRLHEVIEMAASSDLLLDIGTALSFPPISDRVGCTAYVDEAPPKAQVYEEAYGIDHGLQRYDYLFSVGLNIGTPMCDAPDCGREWTGIVHPVVLSTWRPNVDARSAHFSTITNWEKGTFHLDGRFSGAKSNNWDRFIDLPGATSQTIEVALNAPRGYEAQVQQLRDRGWLVRDAKELRTLEDYRRYIAGSRAEFSVANNRYVEFRTGWTSDRSARYLASGKPALVQSTGFEAHLPTGEGLLSFSTLDEALTGIEAINRNYLDHCRAARAIAEAHFDSRKVLSEMLERMALSVGEAT